MMTIDDNNINNNNNEGSEFSSLTTITSFSNINNNIQNNNTESNNNNTSNNENNTSSLEDNDGSTLGGTIFNFTNAILGAGVVGLGGAIGSSGGIISILALVVFAIMTKYSLDLVIELSLMLLNNNENNNSFSYEALGTASYGKIGYCMVLISKFLYSFGCLISYVIVIKDNFGSSILHLLPLLPSSSSIITTILQNDTILTWIISCCILLPLCLLRDMTPLTSLAFVSVLATASIVCIVIYLFIDISSSMTTEEDSSYDSIILSNSTADTDTTTNTIYEHWFRIHPEIFQR